MATHRPAHPEPAHQPAGTSRTAGPAPGPPADHVGGAPAGRRRGARRARVAGGRQNTIAVKLSDDELAALAVRAAAAGLTPHTYLATAAVEPASGLGVTGMSATERRAWATELTAVRRLLAATGNNLNQIARATNAGAPPDPVAMAAGIRASDRAAERATEILDHLHGGRT